MITAVRRCLPAAATAALLISAAALGACSAPAPNPPTAQAADPGDVTTPGLDPIIADPETATPGPTVTPTPLPPLPEGWVEFEGEPLRVSLGYPEGWEVVPYDTHKMDLRLPGTDGWMEIEVIDAESDDTFSLEYAPGMSAEALLNVLLNAAREDGDFGEATPFETRTGADTWIAEGSYTLLSDRVLIGVMALPDRAILVKGHSPIRDEVWDSALMDVYRNMLWALQPG